MCLVSDIHNLGYADHWLLTWAFAICLGLVVAARRWSRGEPARRAGPAWMGAGVALMAVPAGSILMSTAPDMLRTFCAQGNLNLVIPPGQTAPTLHLRELSDQYIYTLVPWLGYMGAGALAWAQGLRPGWWHAPRLRELAATVRRLIPMAGRSERDSLLLGIAAFPILAAGNLVLLWITTRPSFQTGDDSSIFAHATIFHIAMISLAAGVCEELIFRGAMQQGLKRILGPFMPASVATGLAILLQAIPFAYAHASYVNLQHLLFAFLFALFVGVVVEVAGIWCAIALHSLIDFYSIGMQVVARDAIYWTAAALLTAGVLWFAGREYLAWIRAWKTERSRAAH